MVPSFARKIVSPQALAQQAQALRAAGRSVVQCHGCFDIVHPGHVRYLQFARQLGDILVVSLTGDSLIQKGPDRPYIPQELRAENLAALEFVDFVVIDPHPTAQELLQLIQPDVYVKGREYAHSSDPRFAREREIVEGYGGRVIFHSGDIVFSSTSLLRALAGDQQLDEHRLRTLCQRHGVHSASAYATLDGWSDVRAVVVGDLLRERYVICDATGVAGDGPTLALRRLGEQLYWGGAAAVALQLRALGCRPTLIAPIGADAASRQLEHQFAELGVDAVLLPLRPATPKRSTFIADDARLFSMLETPVLPLDSSGERRIAAALRDRLRGAQLLSWCDYGQGGLTPGLLQHAAALLAGPPPAPAAWPPQHGADPQLPPHLAAPPERSAVVVTAIAVGGGAALQELGGADLLVASERQLREATHDMHAGLPAVAWSLLQSAAGAALLVSLRKRGLMSFRMPPSEASPQPAARLLSEFVPSPALHQVDPLGGDEAVLATASLALVGAPAAAGIARRPCDALPLASYLAAAAQALTVSRPGGDPVSLAELRAWLAARPELRPESRFQPDSATVADLARMAPPLPAL